MNSPNGQAPRIPDTWVTAFHDAFDRCPCRHGGPCCVRAGLGAVHQLWQAATADQLDRHAANVRRTTRPDTAVGINHAAHFVRTASEPGS